MTVNHVEETYTTSGVNIGSAPAENDITELVVGSTTLRTASGVGGYTSLNDIVTALQNDSDYAGAPFTISDTNGATAGEKYKIIYKRAAFNRPDINFTKKVQGKPRGIIHLHQ